MRHSWILILTSREAQPSLGAMDDNYYNGTVVDEAQIESAFALDCLVDPLYTMILWTRVPTAFGPPVFTTTGVGRNGDAGYGLYPVAGKVSYADAVGIRPSPTRCPAALYAPEGYRHLYYWTS